MENDDKKVALVAGLIPEEIKALKDKYGALKLFSAKDKKGNVEEFIFKKPDLKTTGAYMKLVQSDMVKASQVLFNACLVKGRNEAANEVDIIVGLMPHLGTLVDAVEVEVKEL
jgi:hypothetical protein